MATDAEAHAIFMGEGKVDNDFYHGNNNVSYVIEGFHNSKNAFRNVEKVTLFEEKKKKKEKKEAKNRKEKMLGWPYTMQIMSFYMQAGQGT
jgi:hypothetical protein